MAVLYASVRTNQTCRNQLTSVMDMCKPVLMSITELGGYPDFTALYERTGFEVVNVDSVRKAVKLIRQHKPEVIVAEFNFQSDFRDRTSSLETIMSSTQGITDVNLIVLYEKEYIQQYQRFLQQFDVFASIEFPVQETVLESALESAAKETIQ